MKKILVTGAAGQIGSELVQKLRRTYGEANVLATDIREPVEGIGDGPFEQVDVTDADRLHEVAKEFQADSLMHLAALLSAKAEVVPKFAWDLNMGGLVNALEVAHELDLKLFTPSSIGAFGPTTPQDHTPQDTIQRPTTMYGVNKVAGELLCDYYHQRFGVDTRGVRFPGLISYVTPPGGGTTDYAVEIYYEAIKKKSYTSYIGKGTKMDMMYMPDALDAIVQLMEADPAKLIHRNAFNISAFSAAPEDFARSIQNHIPEFEMKYEVDPVRQKIADSWPNSIDSSAAQQEWGFHVDYDLDKMTKDMLEKVKQK
ncbi:L-threonine 3-dehydrogenase [Virgibacillus xinjiangensis]|uniref:L-threonine 3-dehydrogenase n=1 Tax=Virgibacillus xinjiangensis TaxID=393090 RepID=A0ABV7CY47_9BACI